MTILPVRLLLKLDISIIFLLKEENFGLSILSKWHMAGKEADIEKIIDGSDIKVSELLTVRVSVLTPIHLQKNTCIKTGS